MKFIKTLAFSFILGLVLHTILYYVILGSVANGVSIESDVNIGLSISYIWTLLITCIFVLVEFPLIKKIGCSKAWLVGIVTGIFGYVIFYIVSGTELVRHIIFTFGHSAYTSWLFSLTIMTGNYNLAHVWNNWIQVIYFVVFGVMVAWVCSRYFRSGHVSLN